MFLFILLSLTEVTEFYFLNKFVMTLLSMRIHAVVTLLLFMMELKCELNNLFITGSYDQTN